MNYKESTETKERRSLLESSSDEEEDDESFNDHVKNVLQKINNFLQRSVDSKVIPGILATLSNELTYNEYYFDEDELNFLISLVHLETLHQTKENALLCIKECIKTDSSMLQKLIDEDFVASLLPISHSDVNFSSSNQFYQFLTAIAQTESFAYVFERFPLCVINEIMSLEGFSFSTSFFEYISCFLDHELDEESVKLVESIFTAAFNASTGREKYIPNLYKLAGKMGQKHLINEQIWEVLNERFQVYNISTLVYLCRFVQTMAFEGAFFNSIDLDRVFNIIQTMPEIRVLKSTIDMLCCLFESEEFFARFYETGFITYIFEKAVDSQFDQKLCYVQLIAMYLSHIRTDVTEFDAECVELLLDFVTSQNDDFITVMILESIKCLCSFAEKNSVEMFEQIVESSIDDEVISEYCNSENQEVSMNAQELFAIIHKESE